jgi:hypothetical protein
VIDEVKQELRRTLVNPQTGWILMFNEAALILANKSE